jgi:hypothetical protein
MASFGKDLPPSPLDDFPIEVQMVAETMIENQKPKRKKEAKIRLVNPEEEALVASPEMQDQYRLLFPEDTGDVLHLKPGPQVPPDISTFGSMGTAKPNLKIVEVDEEDEESDMPVLTPDIMAAMFANMTEHGIKF